MNKLFYPAVFHEAEEGGYWISFPDFPECLTDGDTTEEAYKMAVDALGLAITDRRENKEEIPQPSDVKDIQVERDAFLLIVEFDMIAYLKRTSNKAVKKTLSIPEWMNEEAVNLGVNFSQVLQEALLQRISLK